MNAKSPAIASTDFYKTNGLSRDVHLVMPGGPSMTRQEFAEECDINMLMKRYEGAGQSINYLGRDPNVPPTYADFAEAPQTLLEFMDMMQSAERAFMTLPAPVRREFDNDPLQFVEYASAADNLEQMRAWGLAPPAKPSAAVVESPPAPGATAPGAPPAAVPAAPTHGST